jgi:hypothetical protein
MKQWISTWRHPSGFGWRDVETGMHHGNIRWPEGQPPTPYGCRQCGFERRFHGRRSLLGRPSHLWEQPTQAQIKARMVARRTARKSVCRCPDPMEYGAPQRFAPLVDPWKCEADDCRMADHLLRGLLAPLSFEQAIAVLDGGGPDA